MATLAAVRSHFHPAVPLTFADLGISDGLVLDLVLRRMTIEGYSSLTGLSKSLHLAERMLRVYEDAVLIPYAVEVDNQIISLYDPVVHHPLDHGDEDVDARWILCKRPCIVVGGELIPSMLELRLDEASGIYAAPLQ